MQVQMLMSIYKYSTSIIKHNPKTLPYITNLRYRVIKYHYVFLWSSTTMLLESPITHANTPNSIIPKHLIHI